jgi:hypothetical protein
LSVTGLEARVAELSCWRGKVTLAPLAGGLSIRRSSSTTDEPLRRTLRRGHSRPSRLSESRMRGEPRAHLAGLSPELVFSEPGVMVVRYVEGRTLRKLICPRTSSESSGC